MLRIDFEKPLTALEIRDPLIEACENTAEQFELYACLRQTQQPSLTGNPGQKNRKRIGNGLHKDWYIDFQIDETYVSRPRVVGTLAVKSAYIPEKKQFGGFDYGKFGVPRPTYSFITLIAASELQMPRRKDPEPEMLNKLYETVLTCPAFDAQRLFDIAKYSCEQAVLLRQLSA